MWTNQQQVVFEMDTANFKLSISSLVVDMAGQSVEVPRGFLRDNTAFIFTNGGQNPVKILGQKGYASTQLFKTKQINFESLGIGGLDLQFEAIFRRAFASRVFPPR